MLSKGNNPGSVKRRLALSSSTAVLMMICAPSVAQAQSAAVESVTVSSTRITSGGFDAPTPTTVISAEDITKQAATNVFSTIAQLPSLMGSTGVSVGNGGSSNGVNGLSVLNLRGIGTQRTLVMIDGERVVPSSSIGVSDISQFPQLLIQRVDVVTGGASASWGSDAVSGVVNFILDKRFQGFKLNINGGITTYADDPQAQLQFAAGTSFGSGNRFHISVSGEYTNEAGVDSVVGKRKWYKNPQQLQQFTTAQCATGCPGGSPQWINTLNGKFALFSYGGMVTRGPLQGTAFGTNGTPYQFDYGVGYNGLPATPARNATNTITNCSSGGYCIGGDLQGNQTGYAAMVARLVRGNMFGRVSYELTPEIEIYATAMWSEVVTWGKPTQSFFKSDNLSIGCDNPFLPSGVAAACTANAGPGGFYAPSAADLLNGPRGSNPPVNGFSNGYTLGKMTYGAQNSELANVQNYNHRILRRFVVGAEGAFNAFSTDWTFKTYVEHGEHNYRNVLENILITPYYNAAIDAVQVSTGNAASFPGIPLGSVICRSAVARSVGCQPLNIIGTGGASNVSKSFVQGTNPDGSNSGNQGRNPWQISNSREEVFDVSVSGAPFENWAGPIAIATGFQYREEAFNTRTDCISRGNCANETIAGYGSFGPVSYGPAGNPLLNPAQANGGPPLNPNWYAGNFQPGRGNFHEMEVFLETNVPLFDDSTFGRANLSTAGRFTRYTNAGDVSTWKVGFTWDTPLDGVRLRGLQSRDVRAPNLAELYAGARVNNGSVTDRFNLLGGAANQSISPLPNPITANPNLKPERGQTTELGLVWSPSYIPGLNVSATYYRIGVAGIIGVLSQQQQMDLCFFQQNAQQCSFIQSASGPWAVNGVIQTARTLERPLSQETSNLNLSSVVTDGMDYEASYRFAVDDVANWGVGGNVTVRMLATNVMKFVTNGGFFGAVPIQSAGTNSGNTPHWKLFFSQGYDADNWGLFVNERWFSQGVVNRNWVACASACPAVDQSGNYPTVSSNYMPSKLYFDVGGHFDVSDHTSLYFKVDNALNEDPGDAYSYTPANQSPPLNPALYDTLGRFFHVGIRIQH
jgi:outer membrane cobalamin receptor